MQAGVPEIGIVLRFREGRDGAFQLKEGEREVEKRHAKSLIYRFTVSETEGGPMIECEECKEWFHKECCEVPQVFFSKSEDLQWTCMNCYGKHMRHTLLC